MSNNFCFNVGADRRSLTGSTLMKAGVNAVEFTNYISIALLSFVFSKVLFEMLITKHQYYSDP